jgi:Lon protease-like protein
VSDSTRQLPLFPLSTLLFPGGMLPLVIFEERYQRMLRVCLEGDRRFGVVLIADGVEVGGPATPYLVGTVARIIRVERLPGDRYSLMTAGEERFTIERTWLAEGGFMLGEVRPRPDAADGDPARLGVLAEEVRLALGEYIERLAPEAGPARERVAELTDPVQLTGLAASMLRGENERKQRILEVDSPVERLAYLHQLLRRELRLLDMLARPTQAGLQRDIISPN